MSDAPTPDPVAAADKTAAAVLAVPDTADRASMYLFWSVLTAALLAGALIGNLLFLSLWVSPLEKSLIRLELQVSAIQKLADERGVIIPRLLADFNKRGEQIDQLERRVLILEQRK